jgi:hypothetical protein
VAKPAVAKPGLRVAFIGGRGVISKYSGIETYYEEVGKRLAEMGHDVTVYCRTYFSPAQPAHNGMRLVRLPQFAQSTSRPWCTHVSVPFMRCLAIATSCTITASGRHCFRFFPAGSGRGRWSRCRGWTGSGESGGGPHPPFCG